MIDCHYHVRSKNTKEDIDKAELIIKEKNLSKLVILATYFPTVGSGVSNYRLFHLISKKEKMYMFCSLDFNNYYFMNINEITEIMEEEKVLGIKIYTGYQDIDLDSEKVKGIFELARKHNKTVMFHTGYCHSSKFDETIMFNPLDLEPLCKMFPDVKMLLAHLANPFSLDLIYLMNRYKNVYTDISGLIEKESQKEDAIEYLTTIIKKLPVDRVFYGTDFPVQDYEDTNLILKNISAEDVEKIKTNASILFN